jgi:hypothetical protein
MTRRTENVKAVAGTVRWLRPLIVGQQLGRLAITNANGQTTEYDVTAHQDGERITGFGLAKDNGEMYSIDAGRWYGWTCDCGDFQFRNRECKHIKAVRSALAAAGITIPMTPAPQRNNCGDP